MATKQNAYAKLGIPGAVGATVTLLALALALAPYLADKDFGFLKIPAFSEEAQHELRVLGPILLALSLALFFPLFAPQAPAIRSASSDDATVFEIRNASARYLYVVWLRFDGKEDPEHSYSLGPGAEEKIATYVAHTWRISDANTGEMLRSVVVKAGMPRVEIR